MISTRNNIMTNDDVTMDIPSNIITYCDVTIGHGTKGSVHYVIQTKCSAHNGISTRDLDMEIPFKTGHRMA